MADRDHLSWISSETSRRAKSAVAVALSFIILLGGMGFASWKGYGLYMDWIQKDDYIGSGDDPITVVIKRGDGWGKVADTLMANDVIRDPSLFEREALALSDGPQPGTWNIFTHLPAKTAAAMLNDPKNQVKITLTIPEGRRLADVYSILIKTVPLTQDQIDQAVAAVQADPTVIGLNPAAGTNMEGFLFPATYDLYPPLNTDALSIFSLMAARFNQIAEEIDLGAGAEALGLNAQQVVVVASIIEGEVTNDEDRAKVARAIYNRLNDGMPLQSEAAFRYGRLMADGTPYNDDITTASQQDASLPYNYYIHPGLPPTPIDNPGRDSLEAALNPADGDWLYWVTVNLDTGLTKFTADEKEFWEFVDELDQWCADNGSPTGCP